MANDVPVMNTEEEYKEEVRKALVKIRKQLKLHMGILTAFVLAVTAVSIMNILAGNLLMGLVMIAASWTIGGRMLLRIRSRLRMKDSEFLGEENGVR